MNESQFTKKIITAFKETGAFILKIHGHSMQKSGIPDLLILHPKWKGFVELKIGNGKCSDIQKHQISEIKNRGFPCVVLRWYVENFEEWIRIEDENGVVMWGCSIIDKINAWTILGQLSFIHN